MTGGINLVTILAGVGAVVVLILLLVVRSKNKAKEAAQSGMPMQQHQAPVRHQPVQALRPVQQITPQPHQPQGLNPHPPYQPQAYPQQQPQAYPQQQPAYQQQPVVQPAQTPAQGATQFLGGMPTAAVLEATSGPYAGQKFHLFSGDNGIGRAPNPERGNQISLAGDGAVSADHALIRCESGQFVLYDLASTNGTFRNRERVLSPVPLQSGDTVTVGKTTFTFKPEG